MTDLGIVLPPRAFLRKKSPRSNKGRFDAGVPLRRHPKKARGAAIRQRDWRFTESMANCWSRLLSLSSESIKLSTQRRSRVVLFLVHMQASRPCRVLYLFCVSSGQEYLLGLFGTYDQGPDQTTLEGALDVGVCRPYLFTRAEFKMKIACIAMRS